jgi:diaminopimelate decarboxylase
MLNNRKLSRIAKKFGTPIYVYDKETIQKTCKELKKNLPDVNLYYACKANTNVNILRIIYKEGFGVETVSPGEIAMARKAGVPTSKITFTCGNITERELVSVGKLGIRIYLDSLRQVEVFGKHFPGKEITVRLNQGIGSGPHSHLITGGPDSKFGIDISQINELKKVANKYGLRIVGLHQHIGTSILDATILLRAMKVLLNTALLFPNIKHLDFGGGFGVPYKPEEKKLNVVEFGKNARKLIANFVKKYGRNVEVSFEPGRYLVAPAGNLLVEVNDIKNNPTKTFVGVNSGFNHLVRPTMYDSYHEIVNISSKSRKLQKVTIAGNVCESGDVFAKDRKIAKPSIGDILAIKNAGAYGYSMSSKYNSRPQPKEYLSDGNQIRKI